MAKSKVGTRKIALNDDDLSAVDYRALCMRHQQRITDLMAELEAERSITRQLRDEVRGQIGRLNDVGHQVRTLREMMIKREDTQNAAIAAGNACGKQWDVVLARINTKVL